MALEYDNGILLIFEAMVIVWFGSVVYFNLQKIGVPYTVAMFSFGMLVGGVSLLAPPESDPVGRYYDQIQPNLLFHIFLPVLIFEGSYSIKPFALTRVFRHATLLATAGVLINTLLLGAITEALVPSWSWYGAMLLGSILSATDPVAVVSLLKDLGVASELSACVDAEALINDGTAIILFQLLLPAVELNRFGDDPLTLFLIGVRLTAVACVLGLVSGWLLVHLVDVVRRDELVVTLCSVTFAYIMYYVADELFQTSGVLTLFTSGIYLARHCPSLFPGGHHNMLRLTWHFLVHVLNTLIFTLVGIETVRRAFGGGDVSFSWILTIVAIYFACTMCRLVMILLITPIANYHSYWQIEWKAALILTHGGLRGGVAMILALNVNDQVALSSTFRSQFLEIVCGVVLLTTLINAPTSGKIVAWLNLQAKRRHRHEQMRHGISVMTKEIDAAIFAGKQDDLLATSNWAEVQRLVYDVKNPFGSFDVVPESATHVLKSITMRVFKRSLFFLRDRERCSEKVLSTLFLFAQEHISEVTLPNATSFAELMDYPWYIRAFEACAPPACNGVVELLKQQHDKFFLSLVCTYGDALDRVRTVIQNFDRGDGAIDSIMLWIDGERKSMMLLIDQFQVEKTASAVSLFSAVAAAEVLQLAQEAVIRQHTDCGLSQFDTDALVAAVEEAKKHIDALPLQLARCTDEDAFRMCPLGIDIDDDALRFVRSNWEIRVAVGGSLISIDHGVAVIVRGIAVDTVTENRLVAASAWGLESYLVADHVASPVACVTDVEYLYLNAERVSTICGVDAAFAKRMQTASAKCVAERFVVQLLRYGAWSSHETARSVCEKSQVVVIDESNVDHHARVHSECFTVFVTGGDSSLLTVPGTPPFLVPSQARFRWRPGTVLVKTALKPQASMLPKLSTNAAVDEYVEVTLDMTPTRRHHAPRLSERTSRDVHDGASEHYDPLQCATPVPYFNRAQLQVVAARELLIFVAANQLPLGAPMRNRFALGKAVDLTLQILSNFCVTTLNYEERIYQLAGLEEALANQRTAHEELRFAISRWLERRSLNDPLIHTEIIDGVALLQTRHFRDDAKDLHAAADKIGAGKLKAVFHESDFDRLENVRPSTPLLSFGSFAFAYVPPQHTTGVAESAAAASGEEMMMPSSTALYSASPTRPTTPVRAAPLRVPVMGIETSGESVAAAAKLSTSTVQTTPINEYRGSVSSPVNL